MSKNVMICNYMEHVKGSRSEPSELLFGISPFYCNIIVLCRNLILVDIMKEDVRNEFCWWEGIGV